MASRVVDFWMVHTNVSGWIKKQGTIVTTGPHIVTAIIKENNGPYLIDGVEEYSNLFSILASPDPIQPGTSPLVSWNEETVAQGGEYGFNPYGPLTFTDTGYGYWETIMDLTGADDFGAYSADYVFETRSDYEQALENGEIVPIESTVYFDVYVNGSDMPNIFVNWTAGEELSPVELTPTIWYACQNESTSIPELVTEGGIVVPNESAWFVMPAGSYSYGGSFEMSYLSMMQSFEKFLNSVSKMLHWGLNGEPEYMHLYLRMDSSVNGIGQLWQVTINKDGTASASSISGSQTTESFVTLVRLHTGEPDYVMPDDGDDYPGGTNIDDDGPGRYDPDDIPDTSDFTDPIGFDGNAVLTKTYAVSEATLQNIGQKLWSQSYYNVLKIQNNPIENIVAVKAFPFSMTGTPENIQVGDISFGINGDKVASVQTKKITGSYTYTGKFHNYLDLAPYTSIKINLPYIGLIQLDPADLLGSKLYVEYVIDLVTGQCMAKLYLDEDETTQKAIPYMNLYGQMGVDIPLTSSDRVQTELRAASAAVTAIGSSVGQMVSGNVGGGVVSGISDALSIAGADYTTQRTSTQSPACTSHASPDIFILIERQAADPATGVDEYGKVDPNARLGYAHLHGFPCHKFKTLGSYPSNSFVQVERRTDIQIAMTAEENRMLEELLTSGVYV